jgi:hypothetical protein
MERQMLYGKGPATASRPGSELALFNQASFLLEIFHRPVHVLCVEVALVVSL